MKSLMISITAGLIAFLFTIASVDAAVLSAAGQIRFLRSGDIAFGANTDFFLLSGISSLGACNITEGGVVFRLKDDLRGQRQFSMVLAAKSAGQPITVFVDDTVRDAGGHCFVSYLQN